MIRYLKSNERAYIRTLYEEAFDDTPAFLDYYLKTYVKLGTRCLVEEADGQIVSMLSIHEKTWMVRRGGYEACPVWYLYAIATKKEYRHQGRMKRLIERAIADGKREGIDCIYLIPVNPSVYEGIGFRLVVKGECFRSEAAGNTTVQTDDGRCIGMQGNQGDITDGTLRICALRDVEAQFPDIYKGLSAVYAKAYQQAGFDIYLKKDAGYFREQALRARIEGGDIYLLTDDKELQAVVTGVLDHGIFTAVEYIDAAEPARVLTESEEKRACFDAGQLRRNMMVITHLLGGEQWKFEKFPVMVYADDKIQAYDLWQNAGHDGLIYGQMDEV